MDKFPRSNMWDEHDEDQNEPRRSPPSLTRYLIPDVTSSDSMSTVCTDDLIDHTTVCSEDFLTDHSEFVPTSSSTNATKLQEDHSFGYNTINMNRNYTYMPMSPVSYLNDIDERHNVRRRYYSQQGSSSTTNEPYYMTPSTMCEYDPSPTNRHLDFDVVTHTMPSNNSVPTEIASCSQNLRNHPRVRTNETNIRNSNLSNENNSQIERSPDSTYTYSTLRMNVAMRQRINQYYKYMVEDKINKQLSKE